MKQMIKRKHDLTHFFKQHYLYHLGANFTFFAALKHSNKKNALM